MGKSQEREMITVTKASRATGVPVPTIHMWLRTGQIPGEKIETILGPTWHTTIEAVQNRWEWRGKGGRPRKK